MQGNPPEREERETAYMSKTRGRATAAEGGERMAFDPHMGL